jgi:NADPH2:quinone reductase
MSGVAEQPRPLTCAAVVATRDGGPEVLAVRRWIVSPPGPHELRVRVDAAGISFADLLECQGLHPERYYPTRRRTPFVRGWDVVGVVQSVGSRILHNRPVSSNIHLRGLGQRAPKLPTPTSKAATTTGCPAPPDLLA